MRPNHKGTQSSCPLSMHRFFAGLAVSLFLLRQLGGAPLPAAEFAHLAQTCVPEASLPTLRALAAVESRYEPNALSINYPQRASRRMGFGIGTLQLDRQPHSASEALDWIRQVRLQGITTSVGLLQVNMEDAQRLGISPAELLDPCTNLRIGWHVLCVHYQAAARALGPGQIALRSALSAYNTGSLSRGFANGYVSAILRAARAHEGSRQHQ